jgi:hypothetical protein
MGMLRNSSRRDRAKAAFMSSINAAVKHEELIQLRSDGWRKEISDERYWRFTNPVYHNIEIRWLPWWNEPVVVERTYAKYPY